MLPQEQMGTDEHTDDASTQSSSSVAQTADQSLPQDRNVGKGERSTTPSNQCSSSPSPERRMQQTHSNQHGRADHLAASSPSSPTPVRKLPQVHPNRQAYADNFSIISGETLSTSKINIAASSSKLVPGATAPNGEKKMARCQDRVFGKDGTSEASNSQLSLNPYKTLAPITLRHLFPSENNYESEEAYSGLASNSASMPHTSQMQSATQAAPQVRSPVPIAVLGHTPIASRSMSEAGQEALAAALQQSNQSIPSVIDRVHLVTTANPHPNRLQFLTLQKNMRKRLKTFRSKIYLHCGGVLCFSRMA
jgi:hypothetical protein